MKETPDPARYVDNFESLVGQWQEWHGDLQARGFDSQGAAVLPVLLHKAHELFEAQVQVNSMMLAAIDELKKG